MTEVQKTELRWSGGHATWFPVTRENGARTAMLNCPVCGQTASLVEHEIGADGTVSPSVVCPYAGCVFHDYVRLVGWVPTTH